jgi:hypothetical protein
MPEERSDQTEAALVTAAGAALGLPGLSTVAVPGAMKGLNGLIGTAFSIPTTWLQGVTETIEDRNYERRLARRSIAAAAVNRGLADEALVERVEARIFAREIKRQVNREAVARLFLHEMQAMRHLAGDSEPPAVDDDWLEQLGDHAQEASDEAARLLWAKILARETYLPGTVSTATMNILSRLSKRDAESFLTFVPKIYNDTILTSHIDDRGEGLRMFIEVVDAGLISASDSVQIIPARSDSHPDIAMLPGHEASVMLVGTAPSLTVHPLTAAGAELCRVISTGDDRAIARMFAIEAGKSCLQAIIFTKLDPGRWGNPEVVSGDAEIHQSAIAFMTDGCHIQNQYFYW